MDLIAVIGLLAFLAAVAVLTIGLWHPARRRARAEAEAEDESERQWTAQATLAKMRGRGRAPAPDPADVLSKRDSPPASERPRTPSRGSP